MVNRLAYEETMSARKHTKLLREGEYVAEVDVELIDDDGRPGWGPYLSLTDALKLDDVRKALREGDVAAASKDARVYRIMPVTAA
jgi:hypothetical protein